MGKRNPIRQRTVGWLFWSIAFIILLPPGIYGAWQVVNPDEEWPVPIGLGGLAALFLAGCITWVVNSVLHARNKRQQAAARKQARKK